MNHKITRRRDIFITFPYSSHAKKAFKITTNIYIKLQVRYRYAFKGQLMCSYKRLTDYLVSAKLKYRQTSSVSRTKSQSLNASCILLQLSSLDPLKPGIKLRMTGAAPTTSELSTILLPTKVRLILEVLR